jgi:hypothetical protein
MKAPILFRITAVIFLIFAAGHTLGFLTFRAPTQEGIAVYDAMNRVHFESQGKTFSYGDWYRGFGLSATASMLFEAFFAWYLGSMAKRGSKDVRALGWGLFAWQTPGVVLSWIYFGLPPMVLSAAVTVMIGVATWRAGSATQMSASHG